MTLENRDQALSKIRENIARSGYHLYVVSGNPLPRFAYTIGLTPKIGKELDLAGAIFYMSEDVGRIIGKLVERLTGDAGAEESLIVVDPYGSFTLRHVDPSWAGALMLGAFDFYQKQEIAGLQIVPDKAHWTIDVPDMTTAWGHGASPGWQSLKGPMTYSMPHSSHAVADLGALRGESVTEACRWEEDYWELFAGAGPDIPDEHRRVVPLSIFLDADASLLPILNLPLGEGIWRENLSEWHVWTSGSTE
jgi:hypothetical protein